MNAPLITGAFAGRIPAREPSLPELADRAITATLAYRGLGDDADDDEYSQRDDAMIDARDAFMAKLTAMTGLTRQKLDLLMREGVL